jgi:site-specific recombinase XerD
MVLSEATRDYLQFARHELGHSPSTIVSYQSWLRHFARWLEENGSPDPRVSEISTQQVRRYMYALSARNLRPRTVRGALNAVRALFAYLKAEGAIAENMPLEVRLPKKDAATRLTVNDEDLERLLEATERQHSDFRCVRDRAVLSVLIFCGLRRQELIDLTVQALNLADQSLLVQQGKGKKSRTVYLCDEAQAALRDWLALRTTLKCAHDYLFVTEDRRHFGETSLPRMLEEIKAIAGLKGDPRIKPHSIRHAAATRLLRNGADIRSIQTWLGHSQLQTTAIYLHTDEQQVRRIAPLAGLKASERGTTVRETDKKDDQRAAFFRSRRTPKGK